MTSLFILIALFCTCATLLMLGDSKKGNLLLAVPGGEDADMKIAPKHFSSGPESEDISEAEAEALNYMRQKSAGNIQLARALGERYATLLMQEAKTNFDPWPEGLADSLRAHHRMLLFSYVVHRVVADLSPNPLLTYTALNVFYSELEEKAPQLEKSTRDMASYSLYVLCERRESCTDDKIGIIYAQLCGDKDNKVLIDEGDRYFHAYYDICVQLHRQTNYAQV